jgi:hypothetical protein
MEIETTIQEISGTYYVRIPALMAEYLKLHDIKNIQLSHRAKIKDIKINQIEITFPLW